MVRTMSRSIFSTGLAVAVVTALPAVVPAQAPGHIDAALKAALAKYQHLNEGKNADYIPALAKSVRAQKAIADVSNALGGNPLAPQTH